MHHKTFTRAQLAILLLLGLAVGCQTPSKSGMRVSQFTNFGIVEEGKLYRGDAPRSPQDIEYLVKTHHIRTRTEPNAWRRYRRNSASPARMSLSRQLSRTWALK